MAAAPSSANISTTDTQASGAHNNVAQVPFIRGSGKGRYLFGAKTGLTLGTTTQDFTSIDIKSYDYMRSILLLVTTTSAGTGTTASTYAADAPFNVLTYVRVLQPNGQTMYSVSAGIHAAMITKYGFSRKNVDPRAYNDYSAVAGTTPSFTFGIRIPFELDLRDALGSLPNKDANAPFQLEFGINTLSNVFSTSPGGSPTFTVQPVLEAYDQPPSTLDGKSVETTPTNMNTLQRWTEYPITMSAGQFDARLKKLGNYVRELIFVTRDAAGNREDDTGGWADPVQIVLDEDVKDNIPLAVWKRDIYETWGYGAAGATDDAIGGRDVGVWPYQFCVNERTLEEDVDRYLPTIESEDFLLRGNFGADVSKMTVLTCEVLPKGDIFTGTVA